MLRVPPARFVIVCSTGATSSASATSMPATAAAQRNVTKQSQSGCPRCRRRKTVLRCARAPSHAPVSGRRPTRSSSARVSSSMQHPLPSMTTNDAPKQRVDACIVTRTATDYFMRAAPSSELSSQYAPTITASHIRVGSTGSTQIDHMRFIVNNQRCKT